MVDVVEVPLTKGKVALIDAADAALVCAFKWSATCCDGEHWYAQRSMRVGDGKKRSESMHRRIMQPPEGFVVDHINHNTLDNRRANMRIATVSQNTANRRKVRGKSRYIGVSWAPERGKWRVGVTTMGRHRFLGRFDDEMDAARAYDKAAYVIWGRFAMLNFPSDYGLATDAEREAARRLLAVIGGES